MTRGTKTLAMLAGAGIAAAGLVGLQAEPSQAATARNGICEDGEFCYYYNSNYQGAVSDFNTSLGSYGDTQPACYDFKDRPDVAGTSAGTGRCVKNNAAGAYNRTGQAVTVYYNSNFDGSVYSQTIQPGNSTQFNDSKLYNGNASHRIGSGESSSPAPSPTMAQFYSMTNGRAWANVSGGFTGQCVSLVSKYMNWRWGIGQVYGNARDYRAGGTAGLTMRDLGFTWSTDKNDLKDGDILVWDYDPHGHVGIWYNGQVYHQNWGTTSATLTPLDKINKPFAGRWRKG